MKKNNSHFFPACMHPPALVLLKNSSNSHFNAAEYGRQQQAHRTLGEFQNSWRTYLLLAVFAVILLALAGCAGFVSGANNSPQSTTLNITNVQVASTTTSTAQIDWATNLPANSAVNYGPTTSYGFGTPVNSSMVTSHQVTISGLAAETTYYFQVISTDSNNNHSQSGAYTLATAGFSISGTISPVKGGGGATVTLTGAASATTTANSGGVYTFSGLPGGSYGITPSNAGYTFTPASQNVTVSTTNLTGVDFSANATAVAPTITTQPANQAVTAGQTATFNVVASGTAPLSYQWQQGGVNIAGATGSTYTTPATTTAQSGATFDVVVSNSAGSVTSSIATLTVNAAAVAPTITTQPASQTVAAGQTATFTVTATGTAPLSYQWQQGGVNIAGATGSTYTTPATTTVQNGTTFDVVVSNSAGSVTSSIATLTVNAAAVAPTITTQPASQTVAAGQTATFTVTATGTAPFSYQWQKNGANIAGATSSSYVTPAATTADSGSTFDVVVSNAAGTVTSAAATLTVNAAAVAPTITGQPANQTVTAGQTATFTVTATGTAPLSYQWQRNGVNIAGATGSSYTTAATTTANSGETFDVVVSNAAGTVTSAAATLTVNAAAVAPTITAQPASQTVTAGQTATFTVTASGTAPLSYQWQKNGANIAGTTSSSYTTPATTTSDSGSTFDVVVSNAAGTVTSAAATLTVNPAPAPAIQVSSNSINFGSDVVGTSTSQGLIITNTGTATLSISQISESGAGFTVSGFSLPLNINAGQQATITVAFVPTSVGTASGSIFIVSNATTSPTAISLSGSGIAAAYILGISPTSLNFGSVTTGTSSALQTVTITNSGNSNVTISQLTLSGAGYTMTGVSTPVTLSPSQNLVLSIGFSPTVAGSASGGISIVSNASGSPTAITLSGTGVAPVQHTVALTWDASTSTVAGYNVYRGTVSGGPYTLINSSLVTTLTFTDSTVVSGTTYYYVATAVNSSGEESVYSNEVSAQIP